MKNYIPWICWGVVVAAMSGAIGYACHVTKSALPLLAFIIVPSFKTTSTSKEDDDDES